MSKFYLASRFGRQDELRAHAKALAEEGHYCTSRWLLQDSKLENAESARQRLALEDWEDIMKADRLVAFTEHPACKIPGSSRGGRHVELGLALSAGKIVYVVGYRENVFCCLPQVLFYSTFGQLLESLHG